MNMYLAVRNFAVLNEKIASSIPKFRESLQILLRIIQEINTTSENQGLNRTGLTLDKEKLKKELIALAVINSNKVSILAKLNKNDTLLKEVKMMESDFARLSGVSVLEKAKIVYDRTEVNLDKLAEQGVTAETQKKFLDTINYFNSLLSMPRSGRAERRRETQKLKVLFASADEQVAIMDMAAATVKGEYPDFYNEYRSSRVLVDTGSGSLALKAMAKAAVSGEPVSGAIFTFKADTAMISGGNGNREIVKKTSKKGGFQLKSIDPGNYKVLITREGFKSTELTLVVTGVQRAEMNVELEKV